MSDATGHNQNLPCGEVNGLLALDEAELIEFYTRAQLQRFGGDTKKAAAAMGRHPATLELRLRKWGAVA